MKRFLLWLVGVVLGVGIFLGAVMGVSYAFTTEGGCPDSTAQFGTEALEPNGWCWQVPLIGGKLDKVFASPATLTVQKLGTLYTAHPAITLPDWASYTTLTIQNAYGSIVFVGSVSDYQSFLFPTNGEYKAELSVWRVSLTVPELLFLRFWKKRFSDSKRLHCRRFLHRFSWDFCICSCSGKS